MSGWDDPQAPVYYEAFCQAHSRYARANAALVAHAHIAPGMRLLDVGAGTGRTAAAALRRLGDDGRIVCVEPSASMRAAGIRRVEDARVAWRAALRAATEPFDRVLCGAAIWQLQPLAETIRDLAALLRPGGALCFNIPALYLLEPDEPGGGADPLLHALPALLASDPDAASDAAPQPAGSSPECGAIDSWLRDAGLRAQSWSFRMRLTQDAYAAWLKIPAVAGAMLAHVAAEDRPRRIDAALDAVDRASWRWERWKGWTAWRP
jgi:cyclopropane fatty-acyl-phospholipid synthase-like methyltransferase